MGPFEKLLIFFGKYWNEEFAKLPETDIVFFYIPKNITDIYDNLNFGEKLN